VKAGKNGHHHPGNQFFQLQTGLADYRGKGQAKANAGTTRGLAFRSTDVTDAFFKGLVAKSNQPKSARTERKT